MNDPATISKPEEKDMQLLDAFAKIIFQMVVEAVDKKNKIIES